MISPRKLGVIGAEGNAASPSHVMTSLKKMDFSNVDISAQSPGKPQRRLRAARNNQKAAAGQFEKSSDQ